MTGSVDDFHKTHFIVHDELFSICVLYCWIICLVTRVGYWTREERGAGERTNFWVE